LLLEFNIIYLCATRQALQCDASIVGSTHVSSIDFLWKQNPTQIDASDCGYFGLHFELV
ncbi:hypothetical protein ACJX0J_018026, partial [Zea mays]